ncbi:hypothetical protein EV715DRAFT_207209 [Schizophyllum commune]
MELSFRNKAEFLRYIDALPSGPEWICDEKRVQGNQVDANGAPREEVLELWRRDPIDCIRELVGNPAFKGKTVYAPQRVFREKDAAHNGVNREYSEMWTADWWWDVQGTLPSGSTVTPVILSSDKTQLSTFSGDKQAWPVYLSIGNIAKEVRRKASSHSTILVGYIPVTKLECFSADKRSDEGYRLFHECMRDLLHPLVKAAQDGVEMTCSDGWVRRIHPILSAYVADYPEQCLVCCIRENACPRCTVPPHLRGDPSPVNTVYRDPKSTISALVDHGKGLDEPEFVDLNLRAVDPFWSEMQYCDIFACMTPDILHQLHLGLFKEHYRKWAMQCFPGTSGERKAEMDARFRTMSIHQSMRHFGKGISTTTQWTGHEYKEMEKQFLGAIDGAVDPGVVRAGRGLLDFIYYAHLEVHTDVSLRLMDAAWSAFHANKGSFEELKIRTHFNISKLHNIKHYVDAIRSRGTADGFNTENSERLHIDFAKLGYRASSRKAYIAQMTRWLTRQEAIVRFRAYLSWAAPEVEGGVEKEGDEDAEEQDMEEEEDTKKEGVAVQTAAKEEEEEYTEANYTVAKKPAFPRARLSDLVANHQAPDFTRNLNKFLDGYRVAPAVELSGEETIPVYRQVKVTLPFVAAVASTKRVDTIHALPSAPQSLTSQGVKQETPGRFSTVLVREHPAVAGGGPLNGLRAARVRLIFKLPPSIAEFPHPLAYVDWFTPFKPRSTDLGMFSIAPSTTAGRRTSSIVPVTQLVRSCHLSPLFGSAVPDGWTAANVLDKAPRFYLNPYLRHHDFYLLRYLYDLHIQTQQPPLRAGTKSRGTPSHRGTGRGRVRLPSVRQGR